jgi:uncharacterized membrane protein
MTKAADDVSTDNAESPTGRFTLAALYTIAGCAHLLFPAAFLSITPHWVPLPTKVIALTGLCEISGAIGLTTERFRRSAGICLALYAVCVFPANIKHAIDDLGSTTATLGLWYHLPRLALQPAIVWWALLAGKVTRWPLPPPR